MWPFDSGSSSKELREKELEHVQLNHALALALGPGLLPAPPSMAAAYPALTPAQLEQFDAIARAAIDSSYTIVEELGEATRTLAFDEWMARFSKRHPWVNDANLSRLFGASSYYAWHEALFPPPPEAPPTPRADIAEIRIDAQGRLCVKPATASFDQVYRSATEVHWDDAGAFLYSPKPREWSYDMWYRQIWSAVRSEYGVVLRITPDTQWHDVPADVQEKIIHPPAPGI